MRTRNFQPHNEVIPANKFTWDKRNNTFTAEISELRGHNFNTIITIRNPKTGGEVMFTCTDVKRDREGDWQWMTFMSQSKQHPNLKLVVFND
jgi:hypothetical protein